MIRLDFTEGEKRAFHYERFHHPHPRVQQKMETLWLKSQGLAHHDIARLVGITENTVRAHFEAYLQGGLNRLKTIPFHHPRGALLVHQSTIETYFRAHPPATRKEAAAKIEELTGIRRSPTQVRAFMRKIGMRCRKVAAVPAKANPEVQEKFKTNELMPRLEQAKQGQRAVSSP